MPDPIVANARISTSAISDYLRVKVEPIFRKSVLLNEFQRRGLITYNHGAKDVKFFPRFRRRTISAGDGNNVSIAFPPTNVRKEATLPWRTYNLGERLGKFERLTTQNRDTALFNLAKELLGQVAEDFMEDLKSKFYLDGNASGQTNDLMGLESWFSYSGLVSNSMVGSPNDTYAGLSTSLGNYGGDWTAETSNGWPTGTGDTEYHFWSPLIVDVTNTAMSTESTHTWQTQWQESVRYAMGYLGLLQKEKPDLILVNERWLQQAKNSLKSTQQFILSERARDVDPEVTRLVFDGVEIASEYGVPQARAYCLSLDRFELMSMQKQLIDKTTDTDITTSDELYAIDSWLQLKCESPAYQGKLLAIS